MAIEPFSQRPRRRSRGRKALWALGLLVGAAAVAAAAALLAWPQPRIEADDAALARIVQPGYAGRVSDVVVRGADGASIPVAVRHRRLWSEQQLAVDEPLTVELTVRRPGWAGWLVGRTARTRLALRTPSAELRGRWLEIRPGAPVVASFDTPVRVVALRANGRERTLRFGRARTNVDVGMVAAGSEQAGSVSLSAVPRSWERLPPQTRLSWFPAHKLAQALVEPAAGEDLAPDGPIRLTFSRPVETIFGTSLPTITPAVPGRWLEPDSHTLSFQPSGLGYPLGAHLQVKLPERVRISQAKPVNTTSVGFDVRHGTIMRLQQLLAQAGYLPVRWTPSAEPVAPTAHAQLAAVETPPAGRFRWPYENTPRELRGIWRTGKWNEIIRGAVMMFEHDHGLDVDAFVGPKVWHALLADTLARRHRTDGYSYVYVHRNVPQSLTLWHDGRTILSSPGNTGVPAAPTQLGSFPVFEHIPIGTMSGTNPDGTHYNDPGIRWISYFNHGDAIHSFTRSSFGTPQSLGCVELPLAAAAKVWPYTPIGTLVTVEN